MNWLTNPFAWRWKAKLDARPVIKIEEGACDECGGTTCITFRIENNCTALTEEKCYECDYHYQRSI